MYVVCIYKHTIDKYNKWHFLVADGFAATAIASMYLPT